MESRTVHDGKHSTNIITIAVFQRDLTSIQLEKDVLWWSSIRAPERTLESSSKESSLYFEREGLLNEPWIFTNISNSISLDKKVLTTKFNIVFQVCSGFASRLCDHCHFNNSMHTVRGARMRSVSTTSDIIRKWSIIHSTLRNRFR